jgi:hypothetical protein
MTAGAGPYDELANYVLRRSRATMVIVVVFDGEHGDGYEVQLKVPKSAITTSLKAELVAAHARTLRHIADELAKDALALRKQAEGEQ